MHTTSRRFIKLYFVMSFLLSARFAYRLISTILNVDFIYNFQKVLYATVSPFVT